jgi:uncharacterized membrane protein HdeD (DUF308 family)
MTAVASKRLPDIWWLVLLEGIAVLILGLLLVVSPGMTTMVLVTFIGAYWLVMGIMSLVRAFAGSTEGHWIWSVLIGILGIVAGILVLRHPLWSTFMVPFTLVIILGIDGLIMGVIGIIRGFQGAGWGAVALGVLNIIFGILLLVYRAAATFALPLVLGIFGIIGGVVLIILAFRIR